MLGLLYALSSVIDVLGRMLAVLSQNGLTLRRVYSSGHGVITASDMVHRLTEETQEFGKFPSPIFLAFKFHPHFLYTKKSSNIWDSPIVTAEIWGSATYDVSMHHSGNNINIRLRWAIERDRFNECHSNTHPWAAEKF